MNRCRKNSPQYLLSIKDSETDALVRQLAALTGESITKNVFQSVKERLERLKSQNFAYSLAQELNAIAQRCASLPLLDSRSPEELLSYGEDELKLEIAIMLYKQEKIRALLIDGMNFVSRKDAKTQRIVVQPHRKI